MCTGTANTNFSTINLKKCMYHYMPPLSITIGSLVLDWQLLPPINWRGECTSLQDSWKLMLTHGKTKVYLKLYKNF